MTEDVVALLGECQFVNSVVNESSFQQVTRIATGITSVNEALHVAV